MTTKIDACKIENQLNIMIFIWDCINLRKTNYKDQFKINQILKNEIDKKKKQKRTQKNKIKMKDEY
jgi:hypothetical protein